MTPAIDAHDPLIEAMHAGRSWAIMPEVLAALGRIDLSHVSITYTEQQIEAAKQRGRGRRVAGGAVSVVPLHGLITPQGSLLSLLFGDGPGGLQAFRAELGEALGDSDVQSVVLDIDSPGGVVDQVPETAAYIREARKVKPIVAVANPLAASAAYWLGSQATRMVASTSGETGSIGVYQLHRDVSALNERMGVKPTVISAGKYKTEAHPFQPLEEEGRAAIQQMVDDYYAMFVKDVAQGRGASQKAVRAGYGEGRVLTAQRSVDAGLVDDVMTLDQVVNRLSAGELPRQAVAALEPGEPEMGEMDYTAEDKLRIFSVLTD